MANYTLETNSFVKDFINTFYPDAEIVMFGLSGMVIVCNGKDHYENYEDLTISKLEARKQKKLRNR